MYKVKNVLKTSIKRNMSLEGESIEMKMRRILNNKEPIKDGAPIIFQDRREGVNPLHNVKTDRFEIAVESQERTALNRIGLRAVKDEKGTDATSGNSSASSEAGNAQTQ